MDNRQVEMVKHTKHKYEVEQGETSMKGRRKERSRKQEKEQCV